MKKNLYLAWIALAALNLFYAISGRGNLYYPISVLFLMVGIMSYRTHVNK